MSEGGDHGVVTIVMSEGGDHGVVTIVMSEGDHGVVVSQQPLSTPCSMARLR